MKFVDPFKPLFVLLKKFFLTCFGQFHYAPPQWSKTAQTFLTIHGKNVFLKLKNTPWMRNALVGAALTIIAAIIFLQLRPQPHFANFEIIAPALTVLEKERKPFPLSIQFSESVAPLKDVGKVLASGATLKPNHPGHFEWAGDQTLLFKPDRDWPVGETFSVALSKNIFAPGVRLKSYSEKFAITPFSAVLENVEFYQDPTNPSVKKAIATLRFNYPIDPASMEKRIDIEMDGKKYSSTLFFSPLRDQAFIHSENLRIPENGRPMTFTVAPGLQSEMGGNPTKDKLVRSVNIPGVFDFFRIEQTHVIITKDRENKPGYALFVRTSDAVRTADIEKSISAWLLPVFDPNDRNEKKKPYNWSNNKQKITPQLLQQSEKIPLVADVLEGDSAQEVSFKLSVEPNRHVFVQLNRGLKSVGGYELPRDYYDAAFVPDFPNELSILGDGSILSLTGERKISIFSRNLTSLKVQVKQLFASDIHHFITQTNGDFRSPYFENYNFNFDNLAETTAEEIALPLSKPGEDQYTSFDLSKFITPTKRGFFYIQVQGIRGAGDKKKVTVNANRFILTTDLGVLYKENLDQSRSVFVQNFSTGRAVANATIDILGKNGQAILSRLTDLEGRVDFPNLKDFKHEKEPTLYLVKSGADLTFMPFRKGIAEQSLSRFDVGGAANAQSEGELKAYLFSDRGIYRPGDEVRLGMIVRAPDWKRPLSGVPIRLSVRDARGTEIKKTQLKLSPQAFETFSFQTQAAGATGEYNINALLVLENNKTQFIGSTTVRVEEFQADRFKVKIGFSQEKLKGWVNPTDLKAEVSVENLFGTVAVGRNVRGSVTLKPAFGRFGVFSDYLFFDPLLKDKSFEDALAQATTDDSGRATFDLGLERFERASYYLTFTTEAFEPDGGRSVVATRSMMVSPLQFMLGYKPEGNLNYISLNASTPVSILAIDSNLAKTEAKDLKLVRYEKKFISVLTQQVNGTFAYVSKEKEEKIDEQPMTVLAGGSRILLNTTKPGDFVYKFLNTKDDVLLKINYSVAGEANLSRSLERNAELQIKLAKDDYENGEDIELEIRSPYLGSGIISIEKDKIYTHKFFTATSTTTIQRIKIPEGLSGNAYVSVSFLRDINSKEIFMSPFSFGVVPFSLSRKSRSTKIDIEAPEKMAPGGPIRVRYKTDKPGKILIFAIDEGILQVGRYATPNPLAFYLQKKRLDVRTFQILDLLLPEIRLLLEKAHPGGGEEVLAPSTNLNPFKRKTKPPIAFWSGLLDTDEHFRETAFNIPDYFNGTLRVMAVAVTTDTMEGFAKPVTIQAPVIISPNLPTFVAPGDTFVATVNVANNIEGSGNSTAIDLGLKPSVHFRVKGNATQKLLIAEGRDETARIEIETLNKLGPGDLTFVATANGKETHLGESVSVRPINPYRLTLSTGSLEQGKTKEVAAPRNLYGEFRELTAQHGIIPFGLAQGLLQYLAKFPYGCTEQMVSQGFPYLVLGNIPEFQIDEAKTAKFFSQTLAALQTRLNFEGAFGYYSAFGEVNDFASLYAIHYLLEAKERGFAVPESLLNQNRRYIKTLLSLPPSTVEQNRDRAYAIYLLTRMGEVTTSYLTPLVAKMDENKNWNWKTNTEGMLIAASYQMLKNNELAHKTLKGFSIDDPVSANYNYFYDVAYRDAFYFFLLGKHFPENFRAVSFANYQRILSVIEKGGYNTLNSAFALLAFEPFFKTATQSSVQNLNMLGNAGGNFSALKANVTRFGNEASFDPANGVIRFENQSQLPQSFFSVIQAGFDVDLPTKAEHLGLESGRLFIQKGNEINGPIQLGDEIEVELRLRSTAEGGSFNHVVLVDLLPGGFEPVIDSIRFDSQQHVNGGEYETSAATTVKNVIPPLSPDYVDVHEDRILVYAYAQPELRAFRYRIKAINTGEFQAPPLFAESLYDKSVRSLSLGGHLSVKR